MLSPRRLPHVVLVAAILLSAVPALALDPSLHLGRFSRRAWSEDEGLPQSYVMSMAQSADGYMWFGTLNGVARFDGLAFTVFNWDNHNLNADLILDLAVDGENTLWVAHRGVSRYVNGVFRTWTKEEGLDPKDNFHVLCVSKDGSVWMGGPSTVVHVRGDKIVARYGAAEGVPRRALSSLRFDKDGVLWMSTAGHGVFRFNGTAFERVEMRGFATERVVDLMTFDADGNLWASTDAGLIRRTPDGAVRVFTPSEGSSRDIVNALMADRDGNIWIGVDGEGLLRYANGVFSRFGRNEGLSDDSVTSLFEDRDGALWAGTRVGGVNQFRAATFLNYTMADGLGSAATGPIAQDRQGRIWVGTIGGGLSVLGADERFTTYTMNDGLPNNAVWGLKAASDGTLWAATASGVVALRNGHIRTYTVKDGLPQNATSCIEEDRSGRIWIGTLEQGVSIVEGGRVVKTLDRSSGLRANAVRLLHAAADGTMWVVTGRAIHEVRDDRVVKSYVAAGNVTWIAEESDGTLWFSTFAGTTRIHRLRDGKFASLPESSGLIDRHAYTLLDDGEGHFWIIGFLGVSRVSKKQLDEVMDGKRARLEVRMFDKDDGMLSREGSLAGGSAIRATDGSLWFATTRGISVAKPGRIVPDVPLATVLIQSMATDSGPVRGSTIEGGVRRLTIRYTSPSFALPARTTFSYRLVGFDEDWIPAGNRRLVEYTNLPPGRYEFRVRAENNAGPAPMIASRPLIIAPRWYQTWWSRVLLGASLLLVVVGIYWLRLRRRTVRERRLHDLVRERTLRLQEANRRLEESNLELRQMTFSDTLTRAASRSHFDQYLERELRTAHRDGVPLSLILFDTDGLRTINERHGRRRGDVVLREIAEVLRQAVTGPADLVARFGGDEFAIILMTVSEEDAIILARRIVAAVQTLGTVTITGGVACTGAEMEPSAELLIANAERALFQAKDAGGDRVMGSEVGCAA